MESGDAYAALPGSPAPATLSNRDVQRSADQAAKPIGTGMFIPLVGRSCSSARSKPNRHRNLTTSSLQAGRCEPAGRPMPRRNTSTASLTATTQHHQQQQQQQLQQHMRFTGSSGSGYAGHAQVLYMQQQGAPVPESGGLAAVLRGPGMMLPAADTCVPAHTVTVTTGQQGFSSGPLLDGMVHCRALQQQQAQQQQAQHQQQQKVQAQQQRIIWTQPQQVSPFAALSATAPCAAAAMSGTHLSMGFDAGIGPLGIHQALSLPADAPVYASSAQQYPSTHLVDLVGPCGSQALTTAGSAACIAQDSLLLSGVLVQGGSPLYHGDVLGPSPAAAAQRPYSLTDRPAGQLQGVVSTSVLLPGPNPPRSELLAQASSIGLSDQDLVSAVAAACSSATGATAAEQDELLHSIKQLSMLREVLQLKHQHNELLLLQQQQVLSGTDRSVAWQPSPSHSMQQAMLLPHEGGSGVLLSGTTAAVDAYSDGTTSMPALAHSSLTACNTPATPNMLAWLAQSQQHTLQLQQQQQQQQQQQLQLDPQMLPAQTAASLGLILQDRLSLQPKQVQHTVLSAPTNIIASGMDPTQCMAMQNWGQMSGM